MSTINKVCVLIGEGVSERYFLPSLLENQLGFVSQNDKNPYLFANSSGVYWFFPFPPGNTTPTGGKDRLRKTSTYRAASAIVGTLSYILGENPEVHYRIMADHQCGDDSGQAAKIHEIDQAFSGSKVSAAGHKVIIVENELENWYFAGLTEEFPHLERSSSPRLRTLLSMKPENISDPKSNIKSILSANVHGAIKMGEVMGSGIDLEQAMAKSASFKSFFTGLQEDGLI